MMYSSVDLYDGTRVNIKTSDVNRLMSPLEKLAAKTGEIGDITPERDIDTLSFIGGMTVGEVWSDEQFQTTDTLEFLDGKVHPMRSLAYFSAGCLYERLDSSSEDRRKVFQSSKAYFRDIFLVQMALSLELQRSVPDSEYSAQLRETFERIAKQEEYAKQYDSQTKAFEELRFMLHVPRGTKVM